MTTSIILPEFDPFVISFGEFGIRWYALAYIVGLVGGYWILRREARAGEPVPRDGPPRAGPRLWRGGRRARCRARRCQGPARGESDLGGNELKGERVEGA